jgi:hypothetical protein
MTTAGGYILAVAALIAAGLAGVVLMPANTRWDERGRVVNRWTATHGRGHPIWVSASA